MKHKFLVVVSENQEIDEPIVAWIIDSSYLLNIEGKLLVLSELAKK
jgi:hypothetical protein